MPYSGFKYSLSLIGIIPTAPELRALSSHFDINKDKNIHYLEFIRRLHDPLKQRRSNIVKKAYINIDKEQTGKVTINNLKSIFDVSMEPEFLSGKKSKDKLF